MFDKIIIRLQTFINSKGGAVPVAEKIGKHPNKFYVMFRGETKPNSETIMELKKAYPDLDLNWLYTGIYSDENVAFEKVFVPESDVLKENERLKSELQELRSELSETKQEKRKLFDLLGKHESETESLFVDTEQGIDLMNWILYSQSGFALSERLN